MNRKVARMLVTGALTAGLAAAQPAVAVLAASSDTTSTAASTPPSLSGAAQGVQSAQDQLAVAEQQVRDATTQAEQLAYAVVALRAQVATAQNEVDSARDSARHAIQLSVDTANADPTVTFFATLSGDDPDLATQVNNRRMQDTETRVQLLQQAISKLNSLSSGTASRQSAALHAARRAVNAADKARNLLAAAEQKQVEVRNQVALAAARKELTDLNNQLLATLAAIDAANTVTPGSSGRAEILASSPAALQVLFKKAATAECPGLPWQVLAGISQVETGNGANKNVSSAGAMGPMQFMPATWAVYGVDGDGDGKADILDQADAVFSAAHYLCAAGGGNKATLYQAIFAYNHSDYYVNTVLGIADQYK